MSYLALLDNAIDYWESAKLRASRSRKFAPYPLLIRAYVFYPLLLRTLRAFTLINRRLTRLCLILLQMSVCLSSPVQKSLV